MAVLPPNPQKREENIMNKGLFEINLRENNGYMADFNASMRYMIEQCPQMEIVGDKNDIVLVRALTEEAATLITWLSRTDCLCVTEVRDA